MTRFDPSLDVATPLSDWEKIDALRCKADLKHFVHRAWRVAEPAEQFKWNWHLDQICDVLEKASTGELKRIIFNVPPGFMKSFLVSVFWPLWEWTSNPNYEFATFSHTDDLTIRDNARVRKVLRSNWFQRYFDTRLKDGENEKKLFHTTVDGYRLASSVGGAGVGRHPHRIIIDDPLNPEAISKDTKTKIEGCQSWFRGTIKSRLTKDPVIILIMQRLHLEDLAGYLLSQAEAGGEQYYHVCYQMEYDPEFRYNYPLDPRTEEGELLWPALRNRKQIEEQKAGWTPFEISGQFQQDPKPKGGGFFKVNHFDIIDESEVPFHKLLMVRGWDTGDHEIGTDSTVGVLLGFDVDGDVGTLDPDNLPLHALDVYILDVVTNDDGTDTNDMILHTAALDGKDVLVREERSGSDAGKAVTRARGRSLIGYDYEEVVVSGKNKAKRAGPFRSHCNQARVHVVRKTWTKSYIERMLEFGVSTKDDEIDATSCAYNAGVKYFEELRPGRYGLM